MAEPEGSLARREARALLVSFARKAVTRESAAKWIETVVRLAPQLVAAVGVEDVEKIAAYVWRLPPV